MFFTPDIYRASQACSTPRLFCSILLLWLITLTLPYMYM
jgi:hypothetical protein